MECRYQQSGLALPESPFTQEFLEHLLQPSRIMFGANQLPELSSRVVEMSAEVRTARPFQFEDYRTPCNIEVQDLLRGDA